MLTDKILKGDTRSIARAALLPNVAYNNQYLYTQSNHCPTTNKICAANSGASSPLSAASPASLRIADILIMMDDDPRRRSSSDTRHACTVALVKPGRGASWNHSINSFSAIL